MKFFRLGGYQADIFIIVFFGFLGIVAYAACNAPSDNELRTKPMWGQEKIEYEKAKAADLVHVRPMQEIDGLEE